MCFSVDIDSEDRELLEDTGLDPSVVTSDLNLCHDVAPTNNKRYTTSC
jgi:hypothetical protein